MESSSAVFAQAERPEWVNHMRINDLLHFKYRIQSMKNFLPREEY